MPIRTPQPLSAQPRRAFTLIELLVVIAIIAVLTALTMPALKALSKSNDQSQTANVIRAMISNARGIAIAQHRMAGVVFFEETSRYSLPVRPNQTAMQLIVEDYDQSSARYPGIVSGITCFTYYSASRQYLPEGIKVAMLSDTQANSGSGIEGAENTDTSHQTRVILFDASGNLVLRNGLATYDPGTGGSNQGTYPTAFGDWAFLTQSGARQTPSGPVAGNAFSSPGFFIYSAEEMRAYMQTNPSASDATRAVWLRNHSTAIIVNANTGSILK